ncbi:gliding motility lipoprotein GldH [Cyclobacterium jeungdonense]|uniref:Gliding motility lipoprotein GldH n=1 Tax=Cyclobacterium jeungdonense TaxID=708087 RepID=A0ABT8C5V4_9BACT|nr:gliding motility lipoprotein GldH [Cyclobacterium jeungdonense]MDN3688174.1 gliding motility lipoprotein GldH [Cyclobacterium jeungdonense]
MIIKEKRGALLMLLWVLSVSVACNRDRLYESFQDISSQRWIVTDTLSFTVDSLEITAPVTTSVGIRYNDNYEYHNLYIRYLLKDSLQTVLIDSLLNIGLFDSKTGIPLGKGFGNRRTVYDTLPGNQIPFGSSIHLIQYMRKDSLRGIESVGIKITGSKLQN